MITNIIGASGSGKTSLVCFLLYKYPTIYRKLTPYTTRLKRTYEKEGDDYHFVDQDFFSNNQELVLKRERDDGLYGIHRADLDLQKDKILLTTFPPKGIVLLEGLGFEVKCFHLYVGVEERKKRMRKRGDSITDIEKRLLADSKEYSAEAIKTILSTHQIFLLDGSKSVEESALFLHGLLT